MEEEKVITSGATRFLWSPGASQNTLCTAWAGRRRFWLRKLFAICLVLGLSLAAALFLALALRPAVAVQAINTPLIPMRASALPASARVSPDLQAQNLNLNVNYGHDWVEGNYEAGHTVWITLTESDGHTVKATAVLTTGAVPWWGGQTGFSTNWQGWSSGRPDIAPGDWVYGRMDNGDAATVRVGTVTGNVDVATDSISGTVHADWFTQTLNANCGVWETNGPGRGFTVDPDGGAYLCDFSSEWDVVLGQNVGVQYQEPDGDWVMNVFRELPWVVRVNQSHNWVQGEATPDSTIVATIWRDGLPVLNNITRNGANTGWQIGDFCCGDESQLRTGDVVEIQTSQGLTASVELIPMTGAVDANDETISGRLFGVPFPAQVRGEVWTGNGASVDGQTDASGNYTLDFSPFDVLPDHMVALWYVRPDGHQVCIVRHALHLIVDTGRDRVDGNTFVPGLPVRVMINGGETMQTTSNANGDFGLDFTGDIVISDTVEAWAGAQYASLVVVPVTAEVNDTADVVSGYGPPNSNLNVSANGDWHWTTTDSSGYYKVQYGWDIGPESDIEVQYDYPTGYQTRYAFGLPNVRVNQWRPVGNVERGKEYRYFIEYANDANGLATDVVVTDTLPYSVTYLRDTSGVTPTFDSGSRTIAWHLGTLGAYRSKTFELWVTLDSDVPPGTQLRSRVEISASSDRDPNNNWSETDVWPSDPWVDPWIDMGLEARLPVAGEVLTYQLRYGNNGNRTAQNVIVTDPLPPGTTFVASTFEVGVDGLAERTSRGTVVWNVGTLDPGASRQFELVVRIDDSTLPGTVLANAVVINADNEGDPCNNRFQRTTVVEPAVADLWVGAEIEGDLSSIENEITYRITYHNGGTLAAQDVVLTDTLPAVLTRLWHSAGSVATLADGTIVWRLGTVPPGSGGQLFVVAHVSGTVPAETPFTSTVTASTRTPELDYDNNLAVSTLGSPRVICVPWVGDQPHRIWSGLSTTLKGTATGDVLTTFEWDPGDGSPVTSGTVGDSYAIEARHTYSAALGTVYTATLTVWGTFGRSGTDTYVVQVFSPTHGIRVDVAVDEGLWYIHKAAQRYERNGLPFAEWGGGNRVAENVSAVQAFQVQGHRPGGDPWEDPYVEDVQRGWNAIFTYAKPDTMTIQPAGDPDSDGDGIGLGMYDSYGAAIYESGLGLMALATTGVPDWGARTGPPFYVRGQTYYSITQDVADWFAWGQNDAESGSARGGWRYQPNSGDSDNSNTQFPVLGLAAAEENWGITVPTWVKTELRDYWLAYTQGSSGGFGYGGPDDWNNVGKTGAGIMDLTWTGVPATDARIVRASGFIDQHWDDVPDENFNGNLGEFYAMYAVKKGSQLAGIHQYGSHVWDNEYAAYLVRVQKPDGHFDDAGILAQQPMATAWAVLILSPGLYQPLPVPVIPPFLTGGEGPAWAEVEFDASDSYHTDPERTIAFFEWDFGDGSPVVTATSAITTHTYPTRGLYLALLTAWDDAGNYAIGASQVNITGPEHHPPVADAGGPYSGRVGQEIVLDASGSSDPDAWMGDSVTLYEWNIVGSEFCTTTEPTLAYSRTISGTFTIALRVQDRGTGYGPDSPQWSEPVTTTLTIGTETLSPPEEGPKGPAWLWMVLVLVAIPLIIVAVFLIPRAIGRLRA